MGSVGPNVDRLIASSLKNPMLDEYYKSPELKAEVVEVANEIKRRYLVKLAPHNDTGRLASTARVTTHRSTVHKDQRWEAEFSVGGGRADYADDLEAKYGLLSSVLREMGFYQGDAGATGPTGQLDPEVSRPRAREREASLRRFTEDSFAVNNRLRLAGDPLLAADPKTDRDIRNIRESLSELAEPQRVFRLHSARRLGDLNDLVGKSFPQSGFVSSSADPTFLDNRQNPNQVLMDLEVSPGVRARDISGLSDYGRGESEVLIEDGRNIRITEATRGDDGITRVKGVVE